MRLLVLKDVLFAVCRLSSGQSLPDWTLECHQRQPMFMSITHTSDELSIVCDQRLIPAGLTQCERDWSCIKIVGPLEFSQTGIISQLTAPLAHLN